MRLDDLKSPVLLFLLGIIPIIIIAFLWIGLQPAGFWQKMIMFIASCILWPILVVCEVMIASVIDDIV